ncbi:hypothetical protein ASF58_24145 [Methylobacterium sp. Leaf125]|nr:hypothetical protein ASF58_24145 [Methylobacterium sp. Leaf125]
MRGLALKVLDAEGERLPGAEGTPQHFIIVVFEVFQAPNAERSLGGLKLLSDPDRPGRGTQGRRRYRSARG